MRLCVVSCSCTAYSKQHFDLYLMISRPSSSCRSSLRSSFLGSADSHQLFEAALPAWWPLWSAWLALRRLWGWGLFGICLRWHSLQADSCIDA